MILWASLLAQSESIDLWTIVERGGVAGMMFLVLIFLVKGTLRTEKSVEERITDIRMAADDRVKMAEEERDRAIAEKNYFRDLSYAQGVELNRAKDLAQEATLYAFRGREGK